MTTPTEVLRQARHVVVIDFPDPDVPDSLTRSGRRVSIYGGPDTEDRPDSADLVYAFRPVAEAEDVVAEATRLGARAVWWQSGVGDDGRRDPRGCRHTEDGDTWRRVVEGAGLTFVDESYIGDAARDV